MSDWFRAAPQVIDTLAYSVRVNELPIILTLHSPDTLL